MTGIEIRRAVAEDAPAIVALREEAARWLLGRGIEQWEPGEVVEPDVLGWLASGRMYVAERPAGIAGMVRLAWDDAATWGEQAPDAGYVQALAVARSVAGQGVGRRLLRHVEAVVARSGRSRVRLDCVASNAGLTKYYRQAGYREVGRREADLVHHHPAVTLFERVMPDAHAS